MERPKRSFIRILAPAKEVGIGSLRIGAEMWNYLPNVERTIKIAGGIWFGSVLPTNERSRKPDRSLSACGMVLAYRGTDTLGSVRNGWGGKIGRNRALRHT
jgi:hypothetical protein